LAKLVSHIDKDEILGFLQPFLCLLNDLVFGSEFIFLSPPVKDFPLDQDSDARKVLWDSSVEVSQCDVPEPEAHIRNVFGLLDATVNLRFFDPQSRFS